MLDLFKNITADNALYDVVYYSLVWYELIIVNLF